VRSRQHVNHLLFKELMWRHFLRGIHFPSRRLTVLEPMCGYAEGKSILERYGSLLVDYTGFDYSENLVKHVRRANPDLDVFVQDVTKFSPRARYDLIVLLGGLHHVPRHADAVVGLLSESLAAGGYFINFEPTHNNFILRKVRENIYRRNDLFDAETEEAFELDRLNSIFTQNNLELVRQYYPGLLAYVLYYNPDAFPRLNLGGLGAVRAIFNLEKCLYTNFIGRKFSFATLSLWQKRF
jgi:SAM-dependent methyltransferase